MMMLSSNGWTLAEFAGDRMPDGMRRLLNAAVWDAAKVRDALGRYVAARLGDASAVLIAALFDKRLIAATTRPRRSPRRRPGRGGQSPT